MTAATSAPVRRSLDRARHRKPLRLQITRRRTGHSGTEQFVTQVRFDGREAVVVPWEAGGSEPHGAPVGV
ncbi:MAG: hypothetical protein JO130_14720 [Solirubrobacterales bacterium]|nr:hypothetical protein [Solirubrobacterales bacterium]